MGSLRRNYLNIIATDINVLTFGSKASKRLLKIHHWWLKNKERKVDFRLVERRFLAATNLTGSAEGALVPVFLRITHWTKSRLPVSPPGLFPPWNRVSSSASTKPGSERTGPDHGSDHGSDHGPDHGSDHGSDSGSDHGSDHRKKNILKKKNQIFYKIIINKNKSEN